jgi:hypothetical protein
MTVMVLNEYRNTMLSTLHQPTVAENLAGAL